MAKFLSKCSNQILCVKPQRNQVVDGIVVPIEGEHIHFVNGEYETKAKKEIDFIRGHQLFGSRITEDTVVAEVKEE